MDQKLKKIKRITRKLKSTETKSSTTTQYRLLRRKEVEVITGLSRSSIYAMMKKGSFPKQLKIGQRAVAWREQEISGWIKDRRWCL